MKTRRLRHSVYQVNFHLVWGTKYRRKFLKPYVRDELIRFLFSLQKKYPTWYFDRINTGDDHVHLLMVIPPSVAVATAVQVIKAESSSYLRKKFNFINQIYGHSGIWSVGYFVSTIEVNEETIRRYIELQNADDFGEDVSALFSCQEKETPYDR